MSKYTKNIYWVESSDKQEDWFIVGADLYVAEKFFCDFNGYDLELVSSEGICIAEFEDEEDRKKEAYFPSHEMLIKNGFEVITEDEPRIFWRGGRKFCQGNIVQQVIIHKSNKKSGVYIIEVRDSGLFKIGVTKDIEKRLSQLQTSNPYEFELLGFFITEKNRELENLLHKKFQHKRYKREWFKLTIEEVLEASRFASNFIGSPVINLTHEDLQKMESEKDSQKDFEDNTNLPF